MMPGMDGIDVCRLIREKDDSNPTYIILLTAKQSKENIVVGLEAGANDYIVKPFDKNELRARVDVGRQVVELQTALANRVIELQEALNHVKTLQGIIPICMHCHKIRDDQEAWQGLEKYIENHSEANFSHGICPDCMKKHYPECAIKS
jgi:CheY-like chemotaxis protein